MVKAVASAKKMRVCSGKLQQHMQDCVLRNKLPHLAAICYIRESHPVGPHLRLLAAGHLPRQCQDP